MWVNRQLFDMIVADNKQLNDQRTAWQNTAHNLQGQIDGLRAQKAKDDLMIDWLRVRVNALERERAMLLQKAAGIAVEIPEIIPTRPGSITQGPVDLSALVSFEDVGDSQAQELGIEHDDTGSIVYKK